MYDVFNLIIIFAVIVLGLKFLNKLPLAIGAGVLATILIYRINPLGALKISGLAVIDRMTINTVLAFYCITFLQRMLEKRADLARAQGGLNGMFNNRRINATLAPAFIGALPSAGAVTICGAIVKDATDEYLSAEEQAFVASYYRHIPESFLPTYQSIIIGVELSKQKLSGFLIAMIPMVVVLFLLGYIFYLRKVPTETGTPPFENKMHALGEVLRGLWTIFLTIAVIMIFNLPAYAAVAIAIGVNLLVSKFTWAEIKPMFRSALEIRLILSTVVIMIFKDILASTGAIVRMPELLSKLPIPAFFVFILIFFFGSIISGQQAINVIAIPLAFTTIAGGGIPLLILLMCTGYAAMHISPTHVCLAIVTEYFGVDMGKLVNKTLPVILAFLVVLTAYCFVLSRFI